MKSSSLLLAFALGLAACGGAQTTGGGSAGSGSGGGGSGDATTAGYELIGSVKVANTSDHAVIDVGSRGGQFGIAMIVTDQPMDIGDISLTMGDGEKDTPGDVLKFDATTKMHKFDLPGDGQQYPRKLEFRYLHMTTPDATVTLYAK
jgi:hypothetical protein